VTRSAESPGQAMKTQQDLDAVILLATTLSSKRRPAALIDIVAAAEMIQSFIPAAAKLAATIERLSALGLIAHSAGGYTLTEAAQAILAKQPRKSGYEEIVAALKDSLAAWHSGARLRPVQLDVEQVDAAIRAHKAARSAGKNLLMPKPPATRHFKVEGRWRRTTKAG
jgi:hypothetical protein